MGEMSSYGNRPKISLPSKRIPGPVCCRTQPAAILHSSVSRKQAYRRITGRHLAVSRIRETGRRLLRERTSLKPSERRGFPGSAGNTRCPPVGAPPSSRSARRCGINGPAGLGHPRRRRPTGIDWWRRCCLLMSLSSTVSSDLRRCERSARARHQTLGQARRQPTHMHGIDDADAG